MGYNGVYITRTCFPDAFVSDGLTFSCENSCGEIHPELDTNNRTATEEEENLYMKHFAEKIRELWALGSCDNDVIVFYSQELNKVLFPMCIYLDARQHLNA